MNLFRAVISLCVSWEIKKTDNKTWQLDVSLLLTDNLDIMGFHALSAEIDSLCRELISPLCEGHVNPRTCMTIPAAHGCVLIKWPTLEFEGSISQTPNPGTGYGKKWSKPGSQNRTYQISHYFPNAKSRHWIR